MIKMLHSSSAHRPLSSSRAGADAPSSRDRLVSKEIIMFSHPHFPSHSRISHVNGSSNFILSRTKRALSPFPRTIVRGGKWGFSASTEQYRSHLSAFLSFFPSFFRNGIDKDKRIIYNNDRLLLNGGENNVL